MNKYNTERSTLCPAANSFISIFKINLKHIFITKKKSSKYMKRTYFVLNIR